MAKSRLFRRILSIVTMVIFISSNIMMPAFAASEAAKNTFAAPGLLDPFGPLDPGGWGRMNQTPGNEIMDLASQLAPKKISVDTKALKNLYDMSDYVSVTNGIANPKSSDLTLNSQYMPLAIERIYTGNTDQQGPLGYGWTFGYNRYLQMYEEFKVVEKHINPSQRGIIYR